MTTHKSKVRAGLAASGVGTLAGVVGLVLIAVPMEAEAAPSLPPVNPQELVTSALTADPPAMAGTVTVDNELGLPPMPGTESMLTGDLTARVWWDGQDHRARLELPSTDMHGGGGSQVIVHDGDTIWSYDSAERTAVKVAEPEVSPEHQQPSPAEITAMAQQVLSKVRESSTVRVDGTAEVAGRDAYELVLTPKPTERTLLRSVRVAVDAESRIPLRLQVFASDQSAPVLQAGFTELEVGPQPDRLFEFTPPEGVTVEKRPATEQPPAHMPGTGGLAGPPAGLDIVGEGWDSVVTGTLPEGEDTAQGPDPLELAERFGQPLQGAWGTGYAISTPAGTALITDDGRYAFGAVPEQVLVNAIGNMR